MNTDGYIPDPIWDTTFPSPDTCTNGGTLDADCVKEKRKEYDPKADEQQAWKARRDAIVWVAHTEAVERAKEKGVYTDDHAEDLRADRDASLAATAAANQVYMDKLSADFAEDVQDDCCDV